MNDFDYQNFTDRELEEEHAFLSQEILAMEEEKKKMEEEIQRRYEMAQDPSSWWSPHDEVLREEQ